MGYFRFQREVTQNWLRILFRKNRSLQCESIDHFSNWQFINSYLLIDLKCRNAVWYEIEKKRIPANSGMILLDLEKIKSQEIPIIIHGFRQKKLLTLPLNPSNKLNSSGFSTAINSKIALAEIANIHLSGLNLLSQKWTAPTSVRLKSIQIKHPLPEVKTKRLQIKLNHFKTEDYI